MFNQNVWILHKRARSFCKRTAARSIVNIESKWRSDARHSEKYVTYVTYGQNHTCHHLSALEARNWTKTLRGPELTVTVSWKTLKAHRTVFQQIPFKTKCINIYQHAACVQIASAPLAWVSVPLSDMWMQVNTSMASMASRYFSTSHPCTYCYYLPSFVCVRKRTHLKHHQTPNFSR